MRGPVGRLVAAAALAVMACGCSASGAEQPPPSVPLPSLSAKMKGMTEAGYTPTVFDQKAVTGELARLRGDGVTWLAIQVAWFQEKNTSVSIAPSAKKTPTDASVTRLMTLAHRSGLRVFLNPFVNSLEGSGWQANFHPSSAKAWFASFDRYLAHYASLAQANHVDLFAIGDEFDSLDAVAQYKPYWLQAIATVRRYYSGPIVYGVDYPHYQQVTFWSALDDVGIDAYFPLTTVANPSLAQLEASWRSLDAEIDAWRQRAGLTGKGFVVTELGYPSEDGAAATPGTWFPHQPVNLALQQKCYIATLQTLYQEPWVRGIFFFWWANPSNPDWQGGPSDNGYTLRGKPAEVTLRRFFKGSTGTVLKRQG